MSRFTNAFLIFALLGTSLFAADSVTISSIPTSGYVGSIAFSYSGSDIVKVCVDVDTYAMFDPGANALLTYGCTQVPVCLASSCNASIPYNTFWDLNSPHSYVLNAYNLQGSGTCGNWDTEAGCIVASASQSSTVANSWPISCTPAVNYTWPGTWTGTVNVSATYTGACASDNKAWELFIDGAEVNTVGASTSAGSGSVPVYTQYWPNGNRKVCITSTDTSSEATYADSVTVPQATEACVTASFANSNTASQALTAAHDIYLAPANTFTQTALVLNADGSTSSPSPSAYYYSTNPSVATVGITSGVITAVADGNAEIYSMVPTITGSDLTLDDIGTAYSATYPFLSGTTQVGWLLYIPSGGACTSGTYLLTSYTGGGHFSVTPAPGPDNTTCGDFSVGPASQDNVFVWPTNTMPCVGPHGQYSSSNSDCVVMHEMFEGDVLFGDQPYTPGYLADFGTNYAPGWTFEASAPYTEVTGSESSSGMSAWQSAQASYVSGLVAQLPARDYFYLVGDNFAGGSTQLWGSTQGPAGQWSTPVVEIAANSWLSTHLVLGQTGMDEVTDAWNFFPLQGPVSYINGSSTQSWLESITASGGTCTIAANSIGIAINAANKFIIHGSAVTNMNSTGGSVYALSGSTFPCSGVANGTYNYSNDPGLVLEPYVAEWFASNTSYVSYTAFAQIEANFLAASPTWTIAYPPAGLSASCLADANWSGNGTQSLSYGGNTITQVAGHADMYPANGYVFYLAKRMSSLPMTRGAFNLGQRLRNSYGCYSPALPLNGLVDSIVGGSGAGGGASYGVGYGPTAAIASASGNTITFTGVSAAAQAEMGNPFPGIARMFSSGGTDGASAVDSINNNFYLTDCSGTGTVTCHVLLASSDFSGTFTGGTVTYANGNTKGISSFTVYGTNRINSAVPGSGSVGQIAGDALVYSGSLDTSQSRNNGYTFTVSGTSGTSTPTSACLNDSQCVIGRTYELLAENLTPTASTSIYSREVPILSCSSSCGTATIIHDNLMVLGRNPFAYTFSGGAIHPSWGAAEDMECMVMRCSGTRQYQVDRWRNAWSPGGAFLADNFYSDGGLQFSDDTLTSGQQLYSNPTYENASAKPIWHAHNEVYYLWSGKEKFFFEPACNSPSFGSLGLFEAGCRTGPAGTAVWAFVASDGTYTQTFNLSPYLISGQAIERYIVGNNAQWITYTTLAAGTASDTVTLGPQDAVFYFFPATFAGDVAQPYVPFSLPSGASSVSFQCGYDPYTVSVAPSYQFTASPAILPVDKNFGVVNCIETFLSSSNVPIANGQVTP